MDNTNARGRKDALERPFAEETKELSLRHCPISVDTMRIIEFNKGRSSDYEVSA